jgi:outer membrane protein assembly factor BamB
VYVASQVEVTTVSGSGAGQVLAKTYSNPNVIAFDKANGEQIWKSPVPNFQSTLTFASDHLVLSSESNLLSLDLASGAIAATHDLPGTNDIQESQFQQWLGSSGDTVFLLQDNDQSTTLLHFQIPESNGTPITVIGSWELPADLSRMGLRLPNISVWNNNLVLIGATGAIGLIAPMEVESDSAATPAVPTPESSPAANNPMDAGWGGADRRWNTGTASPPLSNEISELETNVIGPGNVGQAQVFGNVLVRSIVRADPEATGVEAIDLTTGKLLWFQEIDFRGGLASDGERLFIWQTREPHVGLTALDLHTGEQLWNLTNGFSVENLVYSQSPVVSNGVVYFTDGQSNVGAANAVTGELIWRSNSAYWIPPSGPLPVIPEEMTPFVQPNFAVDATHVYVIRANRIIEALDRETGESLWTQDLTGLRARVDTSGRNISDDTPEVAIVVTNAGLIVAQSIDGERGDPGITFLASLDATTGTFNWHTFGNALTGNLATSDTTLFAPISNGMVQAFDLPTGAATVIDPDPASSTQIRLLATTNAIFVMKAGVTGYTIEMFGAGNLDQPVQSWSIADDAASQSTPLPVLQFSGNALIISTKHGQMYTIISVPSSTPVSTTQ